MASTKKKSYNSLTDTLNLSTAKLAPSYRETPLTRIVGKKAQALPSLETLFSDGFDPARRESFEIAKMPEKTTEQMVAKEKRFRRFVEGQCVLYCDGEGYPCALQPIDYATISSFGAIANVSRRAIVTYLRKHPELFKEALDKGMDFDSPELLAIAIEQYCTRLLEGNQPCGPLELRVISKLIQRQIHIHSYDSPYLDSEGMICASHIYGEECLQPPIHLYFDPVQTVYLLMYTNWGEAS